MTLVSRRRSAPALSVFAVWLAALGVRERARLRPERGRAAAAAAAAPAALPGPLRRELARVRPLRVVPALARRARLARAPLPDRPRAPDALPILAALALVAAALAEAAAHVLAWVRARRARAPHGAGSRGRPLAVVASFHESPASRPALSARAPRAPPLPRVAGCSPTRKETNEDGPSAARRVRQPAVARARPDRAFAHASSARPWPKRRCCSCSRSRCRPRRRAQRPRRSS